MWTPGICKSCCLRTADDKTNTCMIWLPVLSLAQSQQACRCVTETVTRAMLGYPIFDTTHLPVTPVIVFYMVPMHEAPITLVQSWMKQRLDE